MFVSGASSGIGYQVCVLAAKKGATIVASARRQNLLKKLKNEITRSGGKCEIYAADALDEKQSLSVIEQVKEHFGKIDIALLNVGYGPVLNLSACSTTDVTGDMHTNYHSMVNYLIPLIQLMKKQSSGFIAHTNSLAGFLGLPMQGPYSAAKSACRILIDTCRIELKDNNIKFLSVYPGFIATEAVADDGMPAPFEMSEEKAAHYIVRAIEKEKSDYLFPFPMRWLIRLARVIPKPFLNAILKSQTNSDY